MKRKKTVEQQIAEKVEAERMKMAMQSQQGLAMGIPAGQYRAGQEFKPTVLQESTAQGIAPYQSPAERIFDGIRFHSTKDRDLCQERLETEMRQAVDVVEKQGHGLRYNMRRRHERQVQFLMECLEGEQSRHRQDIRSFSEVAPEIGASIKEDY